MARHMAESVAKQAQVTTMDEADVTIIKRIREKERTVAAERGVRLTYLAFAIKACTAALKRFPRLNAVLQESRDEFVLKRYYNIGIAVDTKSGLVVPNIKDADKKSIFQIAEEIVDLVDRAERAPPRAWTICTGARSPSPTTGPSAGVFATPVINYPEVAILGMGRVRELPVVREGQGGDPPDAAALAHLRPSADRRRGGHSLPQPGHRLPGGSRPPAAGGGIVEADRAPTCSGRPRGTAGWCCSAATEAEAEPVRAALSAARAARRRRRRRSTWASSRRPGPPVGRTAPRVRCRSRWPISGCDKANTAHLLTCLLQAMAPEEPPGYAASPSLTRGFTAPLLVLQVGIAGALPAPDRAGRRGRRHRPRHPRGLLRHRELQPRGLAVGRRVGPPDRATVSGAELGGVFPLDVGLALAATEVIETIDWSEIVEPDGAARV